MKALYRKYRPKSLDEVVAQPSLVASLKNALKSGKISHAYLFTGPRGTGKTSVARIFAHAINGFTYDLEDDYTDIIEIDAASNNGVDNIRELREKSIIAPTEGKYKVYIVDEVHMLSKSAFNALLKTLEEPPEHVVFILATTDIEKVPITITSRVQIYSFHLADEPTMLAHLQKICAKEKIPIDDSALQILIRRGGGSFRDTLSLLDQISTIFRESQKITAEDITSAFGLPQDSMISALLQSYSSRNLPEVTKNLKTLLESGVRPETLAEELIAKIIKDADPIFFPLLSKLTEVHGAFPEAKILLALTSFANSQNSSPAPQSSQANALTSFAAPQSSQANTQNAPQNTPKPTAKTPQMAATPSNSPEPPANIDTSIFDFDTYLAEVKKHSLGAAMWLKKSTFAVSGDTLTIYPDTPTARGILMSPNNHAALISCVASYSLKLIVSDGPAPKNLEKDQKLSTINDIMGDIKEVNDGGDPF